MSFEYADESHAHVKELKSNHPDGTFTLVGQIRWSGDQREVETFGKTKVVRHAKFIDENGDDINISIWEELINEIPIMKTCKITNVAMSFYKGWNTTTTSESKIVIMSNSEKYEWEKVPMNELKTLCCPEIITVKVDRNVICRNYDCKKKMKISELESKLSKICCNSCKRTMALKKCKFMSTCEIIFGYGGKQIHLTAFNDVISDFFGDMDASILEDTIINSEDNIDVWYDNRRIIQKLNYHDDSKDI